MRAGSSLDTDTAMQVTNNQAPEFLFSHSSLQIQRTSGEQAYVREGKPIPSAFAPDVVPSKRIR